MLGAEDIVERFILASDQDVPFSLSRIVIGVRKKRMTEGMRIRVWEVVLSVVDELSGKLRGYLGYYVCSCRWWSWVEEGKQVGFDVEKN